MNSGIIPPECVNFLTQIILLKKYLNNISKPQNKWYEFFIDPVRFIGNYSSGKQGILIAEELEKHGCDVQIIAGYVNAKLPKDTIFAYTANKMLEASSNATFVKNDQAI